MFRFNALTLTPRRWVINGVLYDMVTSKADVDAMRKRNASDARTVIAVTLRVSNGIFAR